MKKYPSVMMTYIHHPFKDGVTNESSKTIDAAYISYSKIKCRAVGSHLRAYVKYEKGINGSASKYLRTRAGFDLKDDFQSNEQDHTNDSEKGKQKSPDKIPENPYLCVQLWTLYERIEKWTFFDMQTMQRDVSKQFKEDPEKFKLGFCKIITCVFKIVCWTFQGDKDLNEHQE
ncbi:uncharacterized protein FA14DRAFT_183474 [Meira miltonrushii]|uniref:Uncharacterized protein n=1 Tax=Meira miltonrushii TaxID=1280837 RepID=A0A316VJ14_9BASI|nr:uncharacterized protein FA14DRAFT_183474 [Meira miltonrushii]PWN37490.1 hypothetical protein FA14DRAFT_183474 [Meira miltonrushii]